ncbi:TonB family C-terminal domain-containing protein [Hymenobacter arizonensis]|uniref:TonB family C-terminal domain-containing protein n=2 Tax=Hymenobacter arizonensis TaxID=1227077 RepID=A0A1I5WPT1_HYMAR|nr:TonB family C-terminal domain-containing protein [Hymenobacter arizonensis]
MPQLPGGGGEKAILQAIQQRLVYPPRALQAQVEGRVYVNFIVTATGRVDKIEVVKSLVADCDSAVVQAVKRLPRFTPGREEGKAVWVQYTLPVTFRIED